MDWAREFLPKEMFAAMAFYSEELYRPGPGSEELFSQTNPVATGPFGNNPWSAD